MNREHHHHHHPHHRPHHATPTGSTTVSHVETPSMTKSSKYIHIAFMILNFSTIFYDLAFIDLTRSDVFKTSDSIFGGRVRFLTQWNLVLQSIFFTICTFADIIVGDDKDHTLRRIQNSVMTSLAFPLAAFVCVTFWALYAIDRELVFPKALDDFFPVWLNHAMHTNIMIFILAEVCTYRYRYPRRSQGLKILLGFMLVYLVWIHVVYSQTNVWVYPVLEVLNLPMRILFFVVCLLLAIGGYLAGELINAKVWARVIADETERERDTDSLHSHHLTPRDRKAARRKL